MRIRVRIPVKQPLLMGFVMSYDANRPLWIQCRYERIYRMCLGCGCIGHTSLVCEWTEQRRAAALYDQMNIINQFMGLETGYVVSRYHFVNEARAYLNNGDRRPTRITLNNHHDGPMLLPLRQPLLDYEFEPFGFFNEQGVFANHTNIQPMLNVLGPQPLYPLETPEDDEDEDPMEEEVNILLDEDPHDDDHHDNDPNDDAFHQDLNLSPESNNEDVEPAQDHVVPEPEANNAIDNGEPNDSGNNLERDNRTVVSLEEYETMAADPDLKHIVDKYYTTPQASIFPLPIQNIIHFVEHEDQETAQDFPLSWMDIGDGELAIGTGKLVWDPITYPLFGDNNNLSSDEEYFFWQNSYTHFEHFFYKSIEEKQIIPFEHGSSSGHGGDAQ